MEKRIEKERNYTFDVAKALGIIFVVSSHARWLYFTRLFVTFYMALFFFISGYFIYLEQKALKTFIWGKIRTLYIPFVCGGTVFMVLHNFFNSLNITPTRMGVKDSLVTFLNLLIMNNTEMLLIPIWFVTVQFVLFIIFGYFYKIIPNVNAKEYILLAIGVFCFLLNAFFWENGDWYCYCRIVNTVLSSFVFLVMGYCIKDRYTIKINKLSLIIAGILYIIFVFILNKSQLEVDVRQNICSNWLLYFLMACIGIYLTLYASKVISVYLHQITKILAYIGQSTMIILFLHPLIFKCIGLFQIHVLHMPYDGNLQIWGNVNTRGPWAYMYILLGCGIPVLLKLVYKKILVKHFIHK